MLWWCVLGPSGRFFYEVLGIIGNTSGFQLSLNKTKGIQPIFLDNLKPAEVIFDGNLSFIEFFPFCSAIFRGFGVSNLRLFGCI